MVIYVQLLNGTKENKKNLKIENFLKMKQYRVLGVLQFQIPYDVDFKVYATSFKQAQYYAFKKLRENKNLKNINPRILYAYVKKLNIYILNTKSYIKKRKLQIIK